MKKFISTKINKQQWRITVPNLNSTIFRRSPSKEDEKTSKRSSGFYDFAEAQQVYDQTRSLPNSVYMEAASSSSSSCEFEDAKGELEFPARPETVCAKIESKNTEENNGQFEYDVPKISFKFFGKDDQTALETNTDETDNEISLRVAENNTLTVIVPDCVSLQEELLEEYDELPPCHPSEKFVSQTEMFVRSLEDIPVTALKSAGSDPNLAITIKHVEDEDDFYQVPRPLKVTNRLSQSLKEFDTINKENPPDLVILSNHSSLSSIEHISASQIINISEEPARISSNNSKSASKLPKLKKPKILKIENWDYFKNKFNALMQEQAAKQRVGAFNDKEKLTINFEEMYKNSKTKCKKIFGNTSKMFKKKPDMASSDPAFVRKVKASDIEYMLNYSANSDNSTSAKENGNGVNESNHNSSNGTFSETDLNNTGLSKISLNGTALNDSSFSNESKVSAEDSKKDDFDFGAIKNAIKKKIHSQEGQNGFEDLRRYVKQGEDFCKELSQILQERIDVESQYAKSLSKLSTKLSRACRENVGGLNEAWKAVAIELETKAEAHRLLGVALQEETAKPLRTLTENQHRIRKKCEARVDKSAKLLSDYRASEAKGKKNSHSCARENEKLQDAAVLDTTKYGKQTISKSSSLIHLAQIKQNNNDGSKLEGKKRKAEDAVKKADEEYYMLCVRAERARLEWESAVLRGASTFQALEEERLKNLKSVLTSYLHHNNFVGPRLIEASQRLKGPVNQAEPAKDLTTFQNLRQSSQQVSEQLLPDFYCEHTTLAMNTERRKQALLKLLKLIRDDVDREKKSKVGLENLTEAIKRFGSEDTQKVAEKLYQIKSMLAYLEGAKYKVQNSLLELEGRPRDEHPFAPHITITRDKSGLQQSVLKVPQWLKDEWNDLNKSPISQKSTKSNQSDNSDPHNNDVDDSEWLDRGTADGNSNQHDSDFDEFSSNCSSAGENFHTSEDSPMDPIATCRAIYAYKPLLHDELPIKVGDIITVYRQQDDNWWLGECGGNVGIFPANYVELVQK
ncbi:unnamed protein product [Phyllotreta striolata]|uniref:Nostrin n=1 Tax=Phyllotreta striolata TaxID=444603 RepID=A0A9N9TH74_PHYSR|nr:unnamed protein product [Phyllotreta striolata]